MQQQQRQIFSQVYNIFNPYFAVEKFVSNYLMKKGTYRIVFFRALFLTFLFLL